MADTYALFSKINKVCSFKLVIVNNAFLAQPPLNQEHNIEKYETDAFPAYCS